MKKNIFTLFTGISVVVLITVISCSKHNKNIASNITTPKSTTAHRYDTITSLDKMIGDTAIWILKGQYILVTHEKSTDEEYELEYEKTNSTSSSNCVETFGGSARSVAKTSYAIGAFTTFANILSLRSSLPTDAVMHTKGLTLSSPRIAEEKKNVSVASAYLHAISRESDNDYHMIIGDASVSPTKLINCESSALPSTSAISFATIKSVRAAIKSHFGTDFCSTSGYTHFQPAIHISILKGSLFYDIDHAPGTIGPLGFRANTAWEMHPVNSIAF